MKIAIVGSRGFSDKDFIQGLTYKLIRDGELTEFISGGARGVDTWAQEIAEDFELKKTIFKPDWDKYGKQAGYLRNELIVKEADMVLAFWDGKSKGTKHSINLAIKAGKPLNIYIRS